MKSNRSKKLSLARQQIRIFGLILLLYFVCYQTVNAQKYQFNFRQTTLSVALDEVAQKLQINIAFDAGVLNTIPLNKQVQANTTDELLTQILLFSGYTYTFKHNSYLIVKQKNTHTSFSLIGTISDAETGELMPYSNITFGEKGYGITSTVNGSFSLKNMKNPTHLKISYLGYYLLDTTIFFTDSVMKIRLKLRSKSQILKTIEIKSQKLEMIECSGEAGHITLNPKSFTSIPNLGETDIFRVLQLMPGISYSENSSELNIRGGSADQNLVLFDGFTLYNLDHFFGNFSSVNPSVVKDIQVFKGGFDSRYGERISGIVDITGKTGNDSKPLVFGSINLISTNLVAEIPIGKKINVIGAIRQSFSNVYTTTLYKDLLKNQLGEPQIPRMQNMSELEPEFKFYDFNTKISFNASNTEKFSISMYGGKDYLDNSIEGRNPNYRIETVDINEWRNYGVSFSWLKQWNASYFSNLQIGNSGYSNNYTNSTTVTRREMNENNDSILPKLINNFASEESNNLRDVSVNLRNTYLIDVHNQLDFGFVMKYNDFEFEKNVDEIFTYNRLNNRSFLYSAFIQNKFLPHSKISIKPGIRTNYYSNTQKMNVEPRFSLTYNPVKLLTLKMATGKYFQYLSKVTVDEQYGYNRDFWVLSDDNLHPVLTSVHVIGGAAIQMGDFYLDVEGYYKTMRGLQLYLFISPYLKNTTMKDFFNPQVSEKPVPSIFLTGDGKAKGLDVLLRYEKPFYTSWISYSLSSSVQSFKAINNGADIPAPYDHTHELNFVHIASVNKWNFSVVYLFTSGNPYIDSTYYQKFKISRTYARLPNYHRVDISANYNLKLKKSKITFGASIINLFNYSNYHDIYMREFDFDNTSFTETTLVQAQNFTPNFYISFEF